MLTLSLRVVELSLRLLVVLFVGLRTCAGGVGERDRGCDDGLGDLAVVMLKNFIEPSVDEEKGWLPGEILDNSTNGFLGQGAMRRRFCAAGPTDTPDRRDCWGDCGSWLREMLMLDAVRALDAVRGREWVVIIKRNFRAQC